MILSANRRAGISLMEALVAIFVTAIGLLALLTLYPLGALQMGRALKDDRCAQCAWQADGTVRVWWQSEITDDPNSLTTHPICLALDTSTTPTSAGPSMVVALDPVGMNSGRATQNLALSHIPRKQPNSTSGSLFNAMKACSLLDDIFFNQASTPDLASSSTNVVARQGRYNWMALVQRPVNIERYTANLKILVFDGRAPGTAPVQGEQFLSGSASAGDRRIQFPAQNPFPGGPTDANFLLAKGGWLMDAGTPATPSAPAVPRMDFYRIASVTANGTSAYVDFDPPLKNAVTQMVFLSGLAEVFDRPMLGPSVTIADPVP